jgi:hypothetical protein
MRSDEPEVTATNGDHVMAPLDFETIYDEAGTISNAAPIGIVGLSRTDFADFSNFRALTETQFANPKDIVPTAFEGVDPGEALVLTTAAHRLWIH